MHSKSVYACAAIKILKLLSEFCTMESSLRKNSTGPKKRMDIVNEIRERFKNNAAYQPDQGESRKSSTEKNHHVDPIHEPEEIYPIPSRQPQVPIILYNLIVFFYSRISIF